jgi:hypothetical protein
MRTVNIRRYVIWKINIAAGYGLNDRGGQGLSPGRSRIFSLPHSPAAL